MINYEDYSKVEIKIGEIKSAEKVDKSDKLLLLSVDFGVKPSAKADNSPENSDSPNDPEEERDIRTVVSGIATYFEDPKVLVGIQCAFVTNLEPRSLMGFESQAMILGSKTDEGFALLKPSSTVLPGSIVG